MDQDINDLIKRRKHQGELASRANSLRELMKRVERGDAITVYIGTTKCDLRIGAQAVKDMIFNELKQDFMNTISELET